MNRKTKWLYLLFALFIYGNCIAQNIISGIVTDRQVALEGVSIMVAEKNIGTTTDEKGKYKIVASPKDILVFSYVGMNKVEIIVEDVTANLNIELSPNVEELDEVVLTKYKRKTQKDLARTFYSDPTIISSDFGYLSPQTVGYELRVVDGKDLNTKAFDILDAIAQALPGVTIRTKYGERYLFTESYGSLRDAPAAAYELDGAFRGVSISVPFEVDISSVMRIGIIPRDQAIRRYGPLGAGGVVVINTDRITYGEREAGNRPFDQVKLRTNIYTNDAVGIEATSKNQPIYLRELYSSSDENEAIAIYYKHRKNFGHSYVFALETYRFFLERFSDNGIANQIIDDNELLFYQDPIALKALAYVYDAKGDAQKANQMYKAMFLLRPEYGQSYLDLASSYREIEDYSKALAIYARYSNLIDNGFIKKNSSHFFEVFERDFSNLISLKGKEIVSDKAFETDKLETAFQGTRLVFEWNDGEAEFELQFVNPQGHYFKYEHSLFANAKSIQQEKTVGFSCQEFLMDDSLTGEWQINATYLGNKKLSASYLKATIYYNYGLESQREETKVFKLGLKNVNRELFKLNIVPTLTSN